MELGWLVLLGIAVGLAMDAFAVSAAVGLRLASVTPRHVFRLGFHFGLFQFLMPIIGWTVGAPLSDRLGAFDHWAAFGLLSYVGGKMLWEARDERPRRASRSDPTRGLSLVALSVATSLDALAVGISLALLGTSIWTASVVIGLVAALLSALGIAFGGRIGARRGRWAEIAGGAVLILIGISILWRG